MLTGCNKVKRRAITFPLSLFPLEKNLNVTYLELLNIFIKGTAVRLISQYHVTIFTP